MDASSRDDLTTLLAAWKDGDGEALDRLVAIVYPELRQLAHQQLGRRPSSDSLVSAALANEAYLKLAQAGGIGCESRVHFLALCAQVMRRILVDHARAQGAAKRWGSVVRVPLDEAAAAVPPRDVDLVALDAALVALAGLDTRQARLVELRYFGGLTLEEAAGVLGISVETAKRDWRLARAWLFAELSGNPVGERTGR